MGGVLTLEEAGTINGKPPATTGAPTGPNNTNIGGDVFLRGEGRGGGGGGRLLVVNEEGGGSHQGQSINLRTGVDGRKMDSLPAAHQV